MMIDDNFSSWPVVKNKHQQMVSVSAQQLYLKFNQEIHDMNRNFNDGTI